MTTIGALDGAVLLAYCCALAGIGWWAARKQAKTTEEYFLAGRSIPLDRGDHLAAPRGLVQQPLPPAARCCVADRRCQQRSQEDEQAGRMTSFHTLSLAAKQHASSPPRHR